MRKRYLLILSALLILLVIVSGCDVRVLYPPFDDEYTIEDDSLLAVVNPVGSEVYHPGDLVSIEWSGSVTSERVTLELFEYGRFAAEIASSVPNTGQFNWIIPADFDTVSEFVDQYQIAARVAHPEYSPGELYLEARSELFSIVAQATGGLSDVTVSQRIVTITVTDNGTEIDGDTINVVVNGTPVLTDHVLIAAPGTDVELTLQAGANQLEIVAVNEGSVSPNTAELTITNVIEGESVQEWRLATGESGSLTITAP